MMKKTAVILAMFFGISMMQSCEDDKDLHLNMDDAVAPAIVNPESGDSFTLLEDEMDEIAFTLEWDHAHYPATGLPDTRYLVQMDLAENNFEDPGNEEPSTIIDIRETQDNSYEFIVGQMNSRLISEYEIEGEETVEISLRVWSFLTRDNDDTWMFSEPVNINVTTYDDEVFVKPIYMLGDGTPAGWDNNAAIEMYHIEDGEFALVERLREDGDMVKFISILGEWAPQWGAEPGGTAEEGELAYRPTEDDPDPDPIMITELEPGDYRVVADTANMTYHISKATEVLYLLGDATEAGWDNEGALEMTREAPGMFSITTELTAGEDLGYKFIEVLGEWAPQYGTHEGADWESGDLIFRPTEDVEDPANIPAPDSTGLYLIEVNLSNRTYHLTPQ